MQFRVGPWVYRVRVMEGLTDENGKPAAGLCDWQNRTIWLAYEIPARRRLSVLLHELKHAWQLELGTPTDREGDANHAASFAADCWRQLDRQGGEPALMRLSPDGVIDHSADVDSPADPRAAQCPACGGLLNLPIRTGHAEFDAQRSRLIAWRAADCEFCGHLVSWKEAVTSAGVPTGQVIGEPTTSRASAQSA